MSLRRLKPKDSLDLLLDTICNTFGGIILMAVLVALFAGRARSGGQDAPSQEIIERRLARAEEDLAEANRLKLKLGARLADPDRQRALELLQQRERLRRKLNAARQTNRVEEATDSPTERLRRLNASKDALQFAEAQARNSLATAVENARRMEARIAEANQQLGKFHAERTQTLRLPRERERDGKQPLFFIARHGRLYPLWLRPGTLNESAIRFSTVSVTALGGEKSLKAEPIPAAGIEPVSGAGEFRQILSRFARGQYYAAFAVYEDSFAAFNRAKELVVKQGFDYGWEPQRSEDGPLIFGSTGTAPVRQ